MDECLDVTLEQHFPKITAEVEQWWQNWKLMSSEDRVQLLKLQC